MGCHLSKNTKQQRLSSKRGTSNVQTRIAQALVKKKVEITAHGTHMTFSK